MDLPFLFSKIFISVFLLLLRFVHLLILLSSRRFHLCIRGSFFPCLLYTQYSLFINLTYFFTFCFRICISWNNLLCFSLLCFYLFFYQFQLYQFEIFCLLLLLSEKTQYFISLCVPSFLRYCFSYFVFFFMLFN